MSAPNYLELACRYHLLLSELVHHVEHGRIIGPVRGEPKRQVDALLLACFEAVETAPFKPDPDTEGLIREEAAELLSSIRRAGGAP